MRKNKHGIWNLRNVFKLWKSLLTLCVFCLCSSFPRTLRCWEGGSFVYCSLQVTEYSFMAFIPSFSREDGLVCQTPDVPALSTWSSGSLFSWSRSVYGVRCRWHCRLVRGTGCPQPGSGLLFWAGLVELEWPLFVSSLSTVCGVVLAHPSA